MLKRLIGTIALAVMATAGMFTAGMATNASAAEVSVTQQVTAPPPRVVWYFEGTYDTERACDAAGTNIVNTTYDTYKCPPRSTSTGTKYDLYGGTYFEPCGTTCRREDESTIIP